MYHMHLPKPYKVQPRVVIENNLGLVYRINRTNSHVSSVLLLKSYHFTVCDSDFNKKKDSVIIVKLCSLLSESPNPIAFYGSPDVATFLVLIFSVSLLNNM